MQVRVFVKWSRRRFCVMETPHKPNAPAIRAHSFRNLASSQMNGQGRLLASTKWTEAEWREYGRKILGPYGSVNVG